MFMGSIFSPLTASCVLQNPASFFSSPHHQLKQRSCLSLFRLVLTMRWCFAVGSNDVLNECFFLLISSSPSLFTIHCFSLTSETRMKPRDFRESPFEACVFLLRCFRMPKHHLRSKILEKVVKEWKGSWWCCKRGLEVNEKVYLLCVACVVKVRMKEEELWLCLLFMLLLGRRMMMQWEVMTANDEVDEKERIVICMGYPFVWERKADPVVNR